MNIFSHIIVVPLALPMVVYWFILYFFNTLLFTISGSTVLTTVGVTLDLGFFGICGIVFGLYFTCTYIYTT